MSYSLPSPHASELDWLLFAQSGVLTYQQAVAHLPRGRVRGNVRLGRWRAITRGVLLAGNGALTRSQQLWVAVLVAGPGSVLAGSTAAAEAGVRGGPPGPIQVLTPANRHRPPQLATLPPDMVGVMVRRTTVLPPTHLQPGRPTRTTLPRAILDAAAWAGTDAAARAIIAAAYQQRKVDWRELHDMLTQLPRLRRRALIRRTVADLAGGATALSEIDLLRLCRRFRLPAPDLQRPRVDSSGRRRFLDAYWRQYRLVVEVDGAHHMDVRQWEADLRRQNDLWIEGERILRFTSYQARSRPAEVAQQIERALRAAGWQPDG